MVVDNQYGDAWNGLDDSLNHVFKIFHFAIRGE
jgi:hypothetical protein